MSSILHHLLRGKTKIHLVSLDLSHGEAPINPSFCPIYRSPPSITIHKTSTLPDRSHLVPDQRNNTSPPWTLCSPTLETIPTLYKSSTPLSTSPSTTRRRNKYLDSPQKTSPLVNISRRSLPPHLPKDNSSRVYKNLLYPSISVNTGINSDYLSQ